MINAMSGYSPYTDQKVSVLNPDAVTEKTPSSITSGFYFANNASGPCTKSPKKFGP